MKKQNIIAAVTLSFAFTLGHAQESEDKVQAAMLFNIVKYVEWPQGTDKLVIGVWGSDGFYDIMKTGYDGKINGTKTCTIQKINALADASSCSVVFLGKSKHSEFENLKTSLNDKSVLTVTSKENMGRKGSCVNFIVVDGKLRFEINRSVISAHSLKVANSIMSIAILI